MTNFEKWKDEILELTNHNCDIAVVNGKPVECSFKLCDKCEIHEGCNYDSCCALELVKWLYSEYKEPIKLTKREWHLSNFLGEGYVARDETGDLYWYRCEPRKIEHGWEWEGGMFMRLSKFDILFPFIKWEDEEPWKVEDLLKLEVEA